MKDLLISHVADVDGVSPVILLKLCDVDFEYKLLEIYEVETYMTQFLQTDLSHYEHIYIVDVTIPDTIYTVLQSHDQQSKFYIFDHHKTHLYAKEYPNVTIDINECGTSLFYQYLKKEYPNVLIQKENVFHYIETVRDLDIWLWPQKQNMMAPKLGTLFDFYGADRYIEVMESRLRKEDTFYLDDFEERYLLLEEEKKNRYIEKKKEKMFFLTIENYHASVLFAENYRNEIGKKLMQENPDLDCVVTINMQGGISFRTDKENVDLSELASHYGGGGHQKAAGAPVSKENQEIFLKQLFKGCEIHESREGSSW